MRHRDQETWPANAHPPKSGGTHWVQQRSAAPPTAWRFLMAPRGHTLPALIMWTPSDDLAGAWSEEEALRLAKWLDGAPDGRGGITEARAEKIPVPQPQQEPIVIKLEPSRYS